MMNFLINFYLIILIFNFYQINIAEDPNNNIPSIGRINCHPEPKATRETCLKRQCYWKEPDAHGSKDVPYCYFPKEYTGYKVESIGQSDDNIRIILKRQIPSGFIDDLSQVNVDIMIHDKEKVRIKMYDPETGRFEVPIPKLDLRSYSKLNDSLYNVHVTNDGEIKLTRKSTGKVIFHTYLRYLIYSDQFIQLTTTLPSDYIYGLGEHKDVFRKKVTYKHYTMFTSDRSPNAGDSSFHLYGDHPFSMTVEDDEGNSNGMFLFNSNAMDIMLSPTPSLTYRTIGGILDIFIFFGPEPQEVVRQYNHLIGLPAVQPYWALGFQLCYFGYFSLKKLEMTLQRNIDAGIPVEVQWSDVDSLNNGNQFSYDPKFYANLPQFVDKIHSEGRKFIIVGDCGIGSGEPSGTYPPYDDGIKEDIFIKNSSGQILIGKVWNKHDTVFPDFTNPKGVIYWTEQMKKYYKVIKFDGIWNDMDEPSNFNDGSKYGCPNSPYENPQYVPGGQILRKKTLCMTAQQYAGLHYNVHNLFGLSVTIASHHGFKEMNKRGLILSRSTFPGQGHYGAHWSGDIVANWETMRWTIAWTFNFNIFGISLVGSDICGFFRNTTVELCARWSALGAFYPFSRNHNDRANIEHDPVALGPIVINAAKSSLLIRYQLLPYLYTLFRNAHTKGDTVFRPLFFEFPKDKTSYTIETQFMWGNGLMIIPTVEEHATNVTAYIPPGKWFHYTKSTLIESKGMKMTFDSPLTAPPVVLIRGGHIIPSQEAKLTTTESRKSKFTIHVALNEHEEANGELFWDDGETPEYHPNYKYNLITFNAKNGKLNVNYPHFEYQTSMVIDKIIVYGASKDTIIVKMDENFLNHKSNGVIYKM